MSFLMHQETEVPYLTSSLLTSVTHGFSTRRGGVSQSPFDSLNLANGRGDTPEHLRENYRRFCAAIGAPMERVVFSQQTHTAQIRRVTEDDAGKGLLRPQDYRDVDALITNTPNLPLTVFSADCGTLLLLDPVHRAAGAIHAGWRGCAAGIVQRTVQAMQEAFSTQTEDLLCAIGPCIHACCFETDRDVPEAMRDALGSAAEACIHPRGAKFHVDLAGLNRAWLLRAGVLPAHIDTSELCTGCHPELFWSHRKMGNARGGQVAMISLNPTECEDT